MKYIVHLPLSDFKYFPLVTLKLFYIYLNIHLKILFAISNSMLVWTFQLVGLLTVFTNLVLSSKQGFKKVADNLLLLYFFNI